MTDEQRGRAFGRSWRAPPGEGSGLGLAIARRLVETDEDEINSQTYPAAVSMRQFASIPSERGGSPGRRGRG
jgi:signal transduction histidine kinase